MDRQTDNSDFTGQSIGQGSNNPLPLWPVTICFSTIKVLAVKMEYKHQKCIHLMCEKIF